MLTDIRNRTKGLLILTELKLNSSCGCVPYMQLPRACLLPGVVWQLYKFEHLDWCQKGGQHDCSISTQLH